MYPHELNLWKSLCSFYLRAMVVVSLMACLVISDALRYVVMKRLMNCTCRESYDGAGAEFTRQELRALFDVIGTPTWADIEDVQSTPWRRYLEARHLPSGGTAFSLH